jgi:hypothetical protein
MHIWHQSTMPQRPHGKTNPRPFNKSCCE